LRTDFVRGGIAALEKSVQAVNLAKSTDVRFAPLQNDHHIQSISNSVDSE
jgi:hypothetical protein